ncbi:hypothetical protein HYH03_018939 [Edaphochlamys debaryana]|uniref:Uncharacterized protein n=1 Tax=Edaphochlamys debaryana TaxID=47281 RepID=A0A835XF17_9CHLO|nr:hypothetical protein HYH03_018939 [Edaphochlamys debaryana]|eukprot:KAG2482115.1 hypothetical protein HYH03_018939 [Edaphochlamys debaryana]
MADVGAEIQRVQKEIGKVEEDIQQTVADLKALDAQPQSSGLSEAEAALLSAKRLHLYRREEQLRKEKGQLRTKEEQLRTKEEQLRKEKEQLRKEKEESVEGPQHAAVVRATPQVARGPKLRLRQDLDPDLFFFEPVDTGGSAAASASAGCSSAFFLDPEGRQQEELQVWLGFAEKWHRAGRPIPPLYINGLVKTGKSYMLNQVLPAVVNSRYGSGGSGRQHGGGTGALPEPNVLLVDVMDCNRGSGGGGFLTGFLRKLKRSAANQQLYAAASTPIPRDRSADAVADAINDFLRRLPQDRLNFLLVDEAQSFYLLERACPPRGPTLDVDAVLHMRRILKGILLNSPHWVAWAVTGSSMGTLWANVAATPTNGMALLSSHYRINLSPTMSEGVLQVGWEQLKAQDASAIPLPSDLVWRSPPHIAMLAYLCMQWSLTPTASTAAKLVQQTLTQKLIPEVLADLRIVLQVLGSPASQVVLLRQLVDPAAGVEPLKLPPAFGALLESYATERDGRLYLDNPLFAQVLQAVTTESGELLDSITTVPSLSSALYRELVALGECCKDKDVASVGALRSLLQDMASALELTPDELLKADWFVQVRDHRCNNRGTKTNFERDKGAQSDVQVGLRWYHVLLRNILSHSPPPEQRDFLQAYPPQLAPFHSNNRISQALTKTYESPVPIKTGGSAKPKRSKARGAPAAATPGAQVRPHVAPARPLALQWAKRLGRAAVVPLRYMGGM